MLLECARIAAQCISHLLLSCVCQAEFVCSLISRCFVFHSKMTFGLELEFHRQHLNSIDNILLVFVLSLSSIGMSFDGLKLEHCQKTGLISWINWKLITLYEHEQIENSCLTGILRIVFNTFNNKIRMICITKYRHSLIHIWLSQIADWGFKLHLFGANQKHSYYMHHFA